MNKQHPYPLVSIVIPAYNAEKFIAQTIESVIRQSYINWELIIVNDGSTDSTAEIIERFIKKENKITIINKFNSGVSDSRNTGMKKCNGKFIALLDADDTWQTHNLEKKINTLLENPDTAFVFSNMNYMDENGNDIRPAPNGKGENLLDNLLLWNGEVIPGPCSNLVFSEKCLQKNISFNRSLSTLADQHFTVQLAFHFKGIFIAEELFNYRIVKGSMSKSLALQEKDALNAYALYKKENYFSGFLFRQKCFSNMYLILAGSWWKDGNNKWRGSVFIIRALVNYPPVIFRLFKKMLKK